MIHARRVPRHGGAQFADSETQVHTPDILSSFESPSFMQKKEAADTISSPHRIRLKREIAKNFGAGFPIGIKTPP